MVHKTQGGAGDEPVELKEYSPGGCVDPNGVFTPPEDPDSVAPAEPVAGPGPIFITVIDPNTGRAFTFAIPYGDSVRVAHAGSVAIDNAGPAFPPMPQADGDEGV